MASEITGEQPATVGEQRAARIESFRQFWPFYVRQHARPMTRALHFVGSTAALTLAAVAVVTGRPWLLLVTPVVGYGCSWLGHFGFERNKPATFKYPLYSFAADWVMFGKILSGTMRAEVERALAEK
jgi:hypothetical protein